MQHLEHPGRLEALLPVGGGGWSLLTSNTGEDGEDGEVT